MKKKHQTQLLVNEFSNDSDSLFKNKSKPINQPETSKFNKFQIVWAKITGYPWWPAIITTLPDEKDNLHIEQDFRNGRYFSKINSNNSLGYRVDFIADQTHAYLKKNFLLKYKQNRSRLFSEGIQFSKRKRRYFQLATRQADQLFQVLQLSKNQTSNSPKIVCQQPSNSQFSSSEEQENQSQNQKQQKNPNESLNIYQQSNQIQQKKQKDKSKNSSNNTNNFNLVKLSDVEVQKSQEIQINQQLEGQKFVALTKRKRGRPSKKNKNKALIKSNNFKQKQTANTLSKIQIKNVQFMQQENEQIYDESVCEKNIEENQQLMQVKKTSNSEQLISDFPQEQKQKLISQLLQKYQLDKVDQIQREFKLSLEQQDVQICSYQNISISQPQIEGKKFKGSKSLKFIKSALSLTNLRKLKKYNTKDKNCKQQIIFAECMSILGKFKYSDDIKISNQQKYFLINYSKKWTSRKLYNITSNILKNNHIQSPDNQISAQIKVRCFQIAEELFNEKQFSQINDQRKVLQKQSKSNKKGSSSHGQSLNFLLLFKEKLQQCVKFLRIFNLQNWQLLRKQSNFSVQLCVYVKSFSQFFEKQFGIHIKNQQKYEDLVKQLGIQNQKTDFIYNLAPNEVFVEGQNINTQPINSENDKFGQQSNIQSINEQIKSVLQPNIIQLKY